jgi:hypothetical protein
MNYKTRAEPGSDSLLVVYTTFPLGFVANFLLCINYTTAKITVKPFTNTTEMWYFN